MSRTFLLLISLAALTMAISGCGESDGDSAENNPNNTGANNANNVNNSAPAMRLEPSIDINACSVFSNVDLSELGLEEKRRGGSVVGFATMRELQPSCDFRLGDTMFVDVQIALGETYLAGDDTAEVGEAAHFSTNIAGDPELVFLYEDRRYTVTTDGVGDMTTDRESLIDYAERIIANEPNQTGLFDDLSTAEFAGGPAVFPCDLIDTQQVATDAGFSTYLVYPIESSVNLESVSCLVQGDDFDDLETVQFVSEVGPCTMGASPGVETEVEGRTACAAPGVSGIGRELVVDMSGYFLVLSTLQETPQEDVDERLEELAVTIINQLS